MMNFKNNLFRFLAYNIIIQLMEQKIIYETKFHHIIVKNHILTVSNVNHK